MAEDGTAGRSGSAASAALVVGALGVVFGDIGTSTLYTMSTVLGAQSSGPLPAETVYGVVSTLVWTLVLVVSVLYVGLLLSRDNEGEGGLLALFGLLRGRLRSRRAVTAVTVLAVVGAAAFLGDSMITPAISVLSAVEGVETADPALAPYVVPIAVVVLVALFAVQRFGTGRIGALFGPVMVLWFAVLAVTGGAAVVQRPDVLQALSPTWAVHYLTQDPTVAFLSLGSVVLAVTGAEALYADLGHFGRSAVSRAWWLVVLPALVLSYLGQGARVIGTPPDEVSHVFFGLAPSWALLPLVVLATMATMIASQAVITGAYSVVHQAGRLGLLPPVRVRRPSPDEPRRIYAPSVNLVLGVGVVVIAVAFGSSERLAAAYGVAVTVTIVITATLFLVLLSTESGALGGRVVRWLVGGASWLVALTFVVATFPKVADGGWLPVGLALVLSLLMASWRAGTRRTAAEVAALEPSVDAWVAGLRDAPPQVLSGTAVYLTRGADRVPLALSLSAERDGAVHHRVVLLTLTTEDVPRVPAERRGGVLRVLDLPGARVAVVHLRVGYADLARPRRALARVSSGGSGHDEQLDDFDLDGATYYLSMPVPGPGRGLPRWQQRGYLVLSRLTPDPTLLLDLPDDRTVVLGRRIEL
ncbi:KUP/HAK/KT family potassium transporter [Nocardioides sp. CFH 31398]|uniref:KUP/HAK/KT family potassium transporter n=1 Tax=Nocardioides sp. CFH 31398 TaxID=2919579 RepID=UPI001F059035|nr:KUP/HAK/KT family potassium transporter [Nocardioides sp. CFH 31398]MCH1868841.1 KUP/HAK/KT family potassium transporter [Nocardioides sp. CFH 31398]